MIQMKRFLFLVLCGMALSQAANAWEYDRFTVWDADHNGSLSYQELRVNDQTWKPIFDAVDADKNGDISLEELKAYDERMNGRDYVWEFIATTDGGKFTTIQPIEIFAAASRIDCSNNDIAAVDLQYNGELWEVICANNRFSALDFAHNPKLIHLECYGNQIAEDAMDELIASLPTVEEGTFVVVNTRDGSEGNICTVDQVNAARAKGWNVYDNNGGDIIEYAGYVATRGDVNGDNNVSIGDVTELIDYLLSGNATGINLDAADCNQDSSVSIGDVTTLIDYLLSGSW